MCTEILVRKGGKNFYCENVGQLADALSVSHETAFPGFEREYCLCNIDVGALNARRATDDEGCPWPEYVIDA